MCMAWSRGYPADGTVLRIHQYTRTAKGDLVAGSLGWGHAGFGTKAYLKATIDRWRSPQTLWRPGYALQTGPRGPRFSTLIAQLCRQSSEVHHTPQLRPMLSRCIPRAMPPAIIGTLICRLMGNGR